MFGVNLNKLFLFIFFFAYLVLSGCSAKLENALKKAASGVAPSASPVVIHHFAYSNIASPQIAGTNFSVTITAMDSTNQTITAVNGSIGFVDATGTLSPGTVTFTAGVATVNFKVTKATGATAIVSVPGPNVPASVSNTFQVDPGAFSKISCTWSATTQTAGVPFTPTFEAQDNWGNLVNYTSAANITLAASPSGTVSAPVPSNNLQFTAGLLSITNTTLIKAGTNVIQVTDPTAHVVGACASFTVDPGPLSSITTTIPSSLQACQSFLINIQAFDAYGNVKTNYNNPVTITDTGASLTLNSAAQFSSGIANVSATIALAAADTINVQTTAPGAILNSSTAVTVAPGSVSQLVFDPIAAPQACSSVAVVIRAKDACNNIVTSYNNSVTISVLSGGVSFTPSSSSFSAGVANITTGQYSGTSAGVVLQASTTPIGSSTTITGTSASVAVSASTTYRVIFNTLSSITACQNFSLTVSVRDACNNIVTAGALSTATVNLTEVGGASLTPASTVLVAGTKTVTAQITQSGTGRVIHGDAGGGIIGDSNTFDTPTVTNPSQITIDAIPAQMDCAPFTITARAKDACNNTVTSFAGVATWSSSLGSLTPAAPVGNFVNGVLTETTARISPSGISPTVTVNTSAPVLSGTSNVFAVGVNTGPYTFSISVSPSKILQNGTETATASVSNIKNACNQTVPDGTNGTIAYNTANAVTVGAATQPTTSGNASFQFKGNNNGTTGNFLTQITFGGTTLTQAFTLQKAYYFTPMAGQSYKLQSTTAPSSITLANLTAGTVYSAGEITSVSTADTNWLSDLLPPEAGWKNISSDLYGGFGSQRATNTSNGLSGNAMTYATNIGKFVIFGGQDFASPTANYRNNTYLFDPNTLVWNEISSQDMCSANLFKSVTGYSSCTSAPSPRRGASMVYMPATGKVVLFGGLTATGAVAETWEFDPLTRSWTQIFGSQPPKRAGAYLGYNTVNSNVVLFGGVDGTTYLNDAWRYNPSSQTWSSIFIGGSKPNARAGVAGGTTSDGRMYIFGGRDGSNVYNDTWMLNISGNFWSQIIATGCSTSCGNGSPPARAYPASSYAPSTYEIMVFAGASSTNSAQNDLWSLNVLNQGSEYWTQESASTPNGSTDWGGAALQTGSSYIFLAGGLNSLGFPRTDVWKYNAAAHNFAQQYTSTLTGCSNGSSGSEKCSTPPHPRTSFSLYPFSDTPVAPTLLGILGGTANNGSKNDYWAYDPASNWTYTGLVNNIDASNATLNANQSTYLSSTTRVLRFGGTWNGGCRSNDTWELNTSTGIWTQYSGAANCGCSASCAASPPQPSGDGYALVYANNTDRAVLYGVDNNTWEYNPATHAWTSYAVNPGQRSKTRGAFMSSTNRILAYGGSVGGSANGQTWEYNPSAHTWTQYFPGTSPGNRSGFGLAYSTATNLAYLFGGEDGSGNQYNDLWSYDPATHAWTNLTPACTNNCTGPSFRKYLELVFTPQDNCLHLFGGESNPSAVTIYRDDHWRYCPSGTTRGTYVYHMHTFDLSSMTAGELANTDAILLNFSGAGGGDSGSAGIFQVDVQSYVFGSTTWADAGATSTTSKTTFQTTLAAPATIIDGTTRVKVMLTPAYPVGHYNGTGLLIDHSQLMVRYH